MNAEPTIQDVLDAMNIFSTQVDQRFNDVDKRFEQVDKRFEQVDKRFEQIDEQFKLVHKEFGHVYEEFGILRGDFGNVARKSNTKLTVLVDSLVSEKALDSKTAQRILALEPFTQG